MNDQGTALVVGGSSGIGKAAARKLLERGAEVILLSRNPTKLAAAKAELSELGAVETIAVDLHDESQTQAFIEQLDADETLDRCGHGRRSSPLRRLPTRWQKPACIRLRNTWPWSWMTSTSASTPLPQPL